MSQAVKGSNTGSSPTTPSHNEVLRKAVGKCPIVPIKINGVEVPALIDTGSEVSTITQSFFDKNFSKQELLSTSDWLTLKAANGLDIPYAGYFEAKVECAGRVIDGRGILVINDPVDVDAQQRKAAVPALLGMNVLGKCRELFQGDLGHAHVNQVSAIWRQILQDTALEDTSLRGFAKVAGKEDVRVPAGSLCTVKATGYRGCSKPGEDPLVLVEALKEPMPGQLCLVSTLSKVEHNYFFVRIANLSTDDVYLKPATRVGVLHAVKAVHSNQEVEFVGDVSGNNCVTVKCKEVTSEASGDNASLAVDLSGIDCSESEREQLAALLKKHANLFARDEDDLGYTDRVKHQIPLMDDVPVNQPYRRIPPSQYQEVKDHIKQLLAKRVIRESCSPYASPIVVVSKRDGGLRLCVDYRKLNQKTIKDAHPLPRIEESWDALKGAKFFSTLDLASGYYQVAMDEKDKAKTAFTSPFGLYEYERMAFGLCNAPATFQRLMHATMNDLIFQVMLVYLDDILVFASTFREHLARLDQVFTRLQEAGLKLKPSKCKFLQEKVIYLGHQVSAEGVATDPEKIRAVVEWPKPTTAKQLSSFIGFCSYYRRYVKDFSKTAGPLHDLVNQCRHEMKCSNQLRPPFKDRWQPCHTKAFISLKEKLTTAPVLGFADYSLPFIVECDASHDGLGAVLSQVQEGHRRVIAFISRRLHNTEKNCDNYSSMKLELLALKWAVTEKFRSYLLGQKFEVYTDNNPLRHLGTAKLGAVEQRWAAQLALFDYTIKYQPGKENANADALSRLPGIQPQGQEEVVDAVSTEIDFSPHVTKSTALPIEVSMAITQTDFMDITDGASTASFPGYSRKELRRMQENDPCIKGFLKYWPNSIPDRTAHKNENPRILALVKQGRHIQKVDGLLYRVVDNPQQGTLHQLLLPANLQSPVLHLLHNDMGHQGIERTTKLVRQGTYWPGMCEDIENYLKQCERCVVSKAPLPRSGHPWVVCWLLSLLRFWP